MLEMMQSMSYLGTASLGWCPGLSQMFQIHTRISPNRIFHHGLRSFSPSRAHCAISIEAAGSRQHVNDVDMLMCRPSKQAVSFHASQRLHRLLC